MTEAESIEVVLATLQLLAAAISLGVAGYFALDQKKRADEAGEQQANDFQQTMLTIAHDAKCALEDAVSECAVDPRVAIRHLALGKVSETLKRLSRAADAVLTHVPPHASLARGGGALCCALDVGPTDLRFEAVLSLVESAERELVKAL